MGEARDEGAILKVSQPLITPQDLIERINNVPQKVMDLANYVKGQVTPDVRIPSSMLVGSPFASYRHYPEVVIPFFYTLFDVVHKLMPESNPKFADFGGGPGIIAAVAALANYESWSIDTNEAVNQAGPPHIRALESLGIIPPDKVHFVNGSYYLPEYWNRAKTAWLEDHGFNNMPYDKEKLFYAALELGYKPSRQEVISFSVIEERLAIFDRKSHALEENRLISQSSNLNFDLIYCFPSDPMILHPEGFVSQLWDRMKSGSILILVNSNQSEDLIRSGNFNRFKNLGTYDCPKSDLSLPKLHIFKR